MTQKLAHNLIELAYEIIHNGPVDLECEGRGDEVTALVSIEWADGKFHIEGEKEIVVGWYPATREQPAEPRTYNEDLGFSSPKIAAIALYLTGERLDLGGW